MTGREILGWRSRRSLLLLCFSLISQTSVFAEGRAAEAPGGAYQALNEGRADDAARWLRLQLSSSPHDATAHQLLCRTFYSEELADPAIRECEAAVAGVAPGNDEGRSPSSSESYLWLGRAYGLKASRANPILAFKLALRVSASFERAVALDPSNVAALRDLGEFYVAAPSIVGGGVDKAERLASSMMPVSATSAHRLLAQIAEKKGDPSTAETEFKRAVEVQRSPEAYIDLGDFYRRRKQDDQALAAVQTAIRLDHAKDAAIVDAASILTAIHRLPQVAQQLLTGYLTSPARTDSAPAARVHVQLGDLLLQEGDRDRARTEYAAALAQASGYVPARKAIQALDAKAVP